MLAMTKLLLIVPILIGDSSLMRDVKNGFARGSRSNELSLAPKGKIYDVDTGLYTSIREGNLRRVRQLLETYPHLLDEAGSRYKYPQTPLEFVANRNQLAAMKLLLELGADPRIANPLRIAARAGHRDAAELLLAHGAVLDLDSAVALDKRDEVERFLRVANMFGLARQYVNSPVTYRWMKEPLLHVARSRGHEAMAVILLRYGADPEAKVVEIPYFVSDINHKGATIGLTPTGTFTPELDVPIRKP